MAINFPSSLDALTNPTSGNNLNSPDHAGQHSDANDAIEALEAKVGITGVGFNPASAAAAASVVLHEDTDNGTNKITVTAPAAVSSDKTLTLPDATDTLVGKDTTDTLTNKTLTSPIIKTWDGWQSVSDSWSYASADSPTFTITVPSGAASIYSAGMRVKLTQTTVKYFIITAVADTGLTVYGGTDYTLANAAISSISYSTQKAPLGFPLDTTKWTVEVTDVTLRSQVNPTVNTWYNLGSITISVPIGIWKVMYSCDIQWNGSATNTFQDSTVTLSTANNTQSDVDFSGHVTTM